VRKADNLTTILCRCHEIWEPDFLEPSGPRQACNETALTLLAVPTSRDDGPYTGGVLVTHELEPSVRSSRGSDQHASGVYGAGVQGYRSGEAHTLRHQLHQNTAHAS
jgi:hypothetical protein